MPRRARSPALPPPAPPWLVALRADVFAALPEDLPAWEYEGVTYQCRRTLEDIRGQLRFEEVWHDPLTFHIQRRWGLDIQAGAFVGVHDTHAWRLSVDFLLRAIEQSRPTTFRATPAPPPFNPGRFQRLQEGGTR